MKDTYSISNLRRFLKKVSITEGCWEWKGTIKNGIGYFNVNNKRIPAHIYYLQYRDKSNISYDNISVARSCGNNRCVNPDHMVYKIRTPLDSFEAWAHRKGYSSWKEYKEKDMPGIKAWIEDIRAKMPPPELSHKEKLHLLYPSIPIEFL